MVREAAKFFKLKRVKKFLKFKHWLPVWLGVGSIAIITIGTLLFMKTAMAINPSFQETDHPIDQPFVVELNQALRDIDLEQIKITPAIKGEWSFEGGKLFGKDKLVFTQSKDFQVDTVYIINFGQISRFVFGDGNIPDLKFKTETAPSLTDSGMAMLSDDSTIAADYVFEASLRSANRHLRDLQFRIEPAIEVSAGVSGDQYYTWQPKDILPQGQIVTVEIYDTKNEVSMLKKTLKVADEPSLKSPVSQANLGERDAMRIEFNQPIADNQTNKIVFDLDGSGRWESDTVYAFTPNKVAAGKTYGYHIKADLRSKDGGILTHDIDGHFATVGARVVTASSPRGNELSQGSQQIKFTFDRPVNRESAEQHFSVDRGTLAGFSWSGNTLIATVNNLGFQQTVTATMGAGVVNEGFGLPTATGYSVRFTTEIRSVKLGVPAYRQNFAQSCEESSLRMALAYRGISTSDEAILHVVGYDGQPSWDDAAGKRWTDPDLQFVGDVHGSQGAMTGYGVFAGPIAKAARHYGRGAEAQYGVNANWVAQQIHNNNPVVLWGIAGSRASWTSWVTPAGRVVNAPIPTHTRIVVGVKGEPGAPIGFWINDPANGTQIYWTTAQMLANSRAGINQAVAVY